MVRLLLSLVVARAVLAAHAPVPALPGQPQTAAPRPATGVISSGSAVPATGTRASTRPVLTMVWTAPASVLSGRIVHRVSAAPGAARPR